MGLEPGSLPSGTSQGTAVAPATTRFHWQDPSLSTECSRCEKPSVCFSVLRLQVWAPAGPATPTCQRPPKWVYVLLWGLKPPGTLKKKSLLEEPKMQVLSQNQLILLCPQLLTPVKLPLIMQSTSSISFKTKYYYFRIIWSNHMTKQPAIKLINTFHSWSSLKQNWKKITSCRETFKMSCLAWEIWWQNQHRDVLCWRTWGSEQLMFLVRCLACRTHHDVFWRVRS